MTQTVISRPAISAAPYYGKWIQTERTTHSEWISLIKREPKAAALAHFLVARVDSRNEVIITANLVAELLGCSSAKAKLALKVLVAEKWVKLDEVRGGKLRCTVNSRVAWTDERSKLCEAMLSSNIGTGNEEFDAKKLLHTDLRRISTLRVCKTASVS